MVFALPEIGVRVTNVTQRGFCQARLSNREVAAMMLGAVTYNVLKDWDLETLIHLKRAAGRPKDLERIADGACDLPGLARLDDEAALAQLRRLKGIGRWTAQVYLLFALGRPDIWPDGDLALQLAVQRLKRLPERPQAAAVAALGDSWRPWRSVAACLLWQSYLHALGRLGNGRRPAT